MRETEGELVNEWHLEYTATGTPQENDDTSNTRIWSHSQQFSGDVNYQLCYVRSHINCR